jgi:hypothetical protein
MAALGASATEIDETPDRHDGGADAKDLKEGFVATWSIRPVAVTVVASVLVLMDHAWIGDESGDTNRRQSHASRCCPDVASLGRRARQRRAESHYE